MKNFMKIKYALSFFFISLCAFFMRTHHLNRETKRIKNAIGADFIPFTVESAIMYSYSAAVAEGKNIAGYDPALLGVSNLKVSQQMTLGLEYFLGYGYKLKCLFTGKPKNAISKYEDNPDFSKWVRFQIRLWTSFASGLIFLWLVTLRCPFLLALGGGLLHAISPAAIARYTGQDLVRGEFCLPLIILSFVLASALIYGRENDTQSNSISEPTINFSILSPVFLYLLLGLVVFCAFATWDMCQICFGLWALCEIVRIILGGRCSAKRFHVWLIIYITIVLAAILIPYHREHMLIMSPLVLILIPSILGISFFKTPSRLKRGLLLCVIVLTLFGVWKTLTYNTTFVKNYSHFSELLKAKLKFNNKKPVDPNKLSFDARVLWTPAMHSPSWKSIKLLFPGALFAFYILIILGFSLYDTRRHLLRGLYRSFLPIFMTTAYFIGFIYIFRYHVFCILFLCIALPLIIADIMQAGKVIAIAGAAIFSLLIIRVLVISLSIQRHYEAAYFKCTADLIKWLRSEKFYNQPVLGDFMISPLLKAYCHSKILLQPKYELPQVRNAFKKFIEIMYHGSEIDLNKFCVKYGIKYVLYDRGYGSDAPIHIYSPRYFAAARYLKKKSPAWKMFHTPDKLNWFYRIAPSSQYKNMPLKYTLFRVIYPSDRMRALELVNRADFALYAGAKKTAAYLIKKALYLDPNSKDAYLLYYKILKKIPLIKLQNYYEYGK